MQPDTPPLEFWIDVNLPSAMKTWIIDGFKIKAKSFIELGYGTTDHAVVFNDASKLENIIIITTKDTDYVYLRNEKKINFPKVLHINTGNISKADLKKLVFTSFDNIIGIFKETKHLIVELNTDK